jgi:molybdate transport system substrate-binding protein
MTSVLTKVVSEEPDVKSIVGKLALGQAEAGFVYTTDVRAASDRVRAIRIPPWAQPKVHYEVAVVRSSEHRAAARAWVARLSQGRARRLLRAAGFGIR